MNLVKEDLLGIQKDRMKIGASLADVDPMQIDKTVGPFMENLSIFNHVLESLRWIRGTAVIEHPLNGTCLDSEIENEHDRALLE